MRTIIPLIAIAFCFLRPVRAADVQFWFGDFTSRPQTSRSLALYPIPGGIGPTNSLGMITRDRFYGQTGTNGYVTVTNVWPGAYRSELQGTWGVTTNYFQFPDTNGTINAKDYEVRGTNTLISGSAVAYSQAQSDQKFWSKTGLRPGNYLTARTNGAVVYWDAEPGLTNGGVWRLNSNFGTQPASGLEIGNRSDFGQASNDWFSISDADAGMLFGIHTAGDGATVFKFPVHADGSGVSNVVASGVRLPLSFTNEWADYAFKMLVETGRLGAPLTITNVGDNGWMEFSTDGQLQVSGPVVAESLKGDGLWVTNIPGGNIQAGTINSNRLDAATLASLAGGGGGGAGEYHAKTFGAVGDGVTDDTAAMLATVNAANTNFWGVIDLDGGIYKITSTLKLTNVNTTIRNGKLLTAENINVLWLANDRQKVENVMIGGPASPSSGSTLIRIEVVGSYIQEPVLDRVKTTNGFVGVYAKMPVHFKVMNCQITACVTTNLMMQGGDEYFIFNSTFGMNDSVNRDMQDSGYVPAGTIGSSVGIGISPTGLGGIIQGCDINFCGIGISAVGGGKIIIKDCNFEDYRGATGTGLIDLQDLWLVDISHCFMNAMMVAGGTTDQVGIALRNCRLPGIKIANVIHNSVAVGIDIPTYNGDNGAKGPFITGGSSCTWRIAGVNYSGSNLITENNPAYIKTTVFGADVDRAKAQFFDYSGGAYITSGNNSFAVQGPTYNHQFSVASGVAAVESIFQLGSSGAVRWSKGSGSPEGAITADIGSMYSRTDGGARTSLYFKETSGNTGWRSMEYYQTNGVITHYGTDPGNASAAATFIEPPEYNSRIVFGSAAKAAYALDFRYVYQFENIASLYATYLGHEYAGWVGGNSGQQSTFQSYFGTVLKPNMGGGWATTYSAVGGLNDYGLLIAGQDAAAVQLGVRGHASQTANLQNWQVSTTTKASVDAAGEMMAQSFRVQAGGVQILSGADNPPTATAPNGSLYLSTGGNGKMFLRVNGAWVEK